MLVINSELLKLFLALYNSSILTVRMNKITLWLHTIWNHSKVMGQNNENVEQAKPKHQIRIDIPL